MEVEPVEEEAVAKEEDPLVQRSSITTGKKQRPSQLWSRSISQWLYRDRPPTAPSLEDAWDYFEQYVLPRKMSAGNSTSSLYNVWQTPLEDLSPFGTGILVYFFTLRALVAICLAAYILYLPTIWYYKSSSYDPNTTGRSGFFLSGSMMCTSHTWVPCPSCHPDDGLWEAHRIATGIVSNTSTDSHVTFVWKNDCAPLTWAQGLNHMVVVVFLMVAILALGHYQKQRELQYDEQILTAQDYSIVVYNPPLDATAPQEWKEFFEQFGAVVYVTVALDNETLVDALVKRRALLQKAGYKLPGFEDKVPLQEFPANLRDEHPLMYRNFQKAQAKCHNLLLGKDYDATSIFVTFETELAQRKALEALMVSKVAIATNDATALTALPESLKFRGTLVLDITEADEPSVIRWKDLNETIPLRIIQRVATGSITVAMIYFGFRAVEYAFSVDVQIAAFTIAILNILVPNIFKCVNKLEAHTGEGTYQASLYAKISVFRFVNTAIVTTLIKPFTATIAGAEDISLIPAVFAVLKAEIVTAPLIHMLDIVGHLKRHILAPRLAENQAAMNSFFRGSKQDLGEKYTNMTKTIFFSFFYSVLFPSGFLLGALAISATYATDKFLLLRSWGAMPELGDDVAKLSRRLFFPICLVTLAIVSQFYWSAYPFDNVCDTDETVDSKENNLIGTYTLSTGKDPQSSFFVTVIPGNKLYRYCDQDYMERFSALISFFHMEKDDWMSLEQEEWTYLFGLLWIGTLVVIGAVALYRDIAPQIRKVVQADFVSGCFIAVGTKETIAAHLYISQCRFSFSDDTGTRLRRAIQRPNEHSSVRPSYISSKVPVSLACL